MRQKRSSKDIRNDTKKYYAGLAKFPPNREASERFKRPAYGTKHETAAGYWAKKNDIKGGNVSG